MKIGYLLFIYDEKLFIRRIFFNKDFLLLHTIDNINIKIFFIFSIDLVKSKYFYHAIMFIKLYLHYENKKLQVIARKLLELVT